MSDSIFNNVTINNADGDPINLKVGSTAARVTFNNTGTGLSGEEVQTIIKQVLGQNGYAVCSTAGITAAKTATIDNFVLRTGAKAVITFENENTATSPTLNISSTGAKAITVNGVAVGADIIKAGYVFLVNYNGTSYDIVGGVGNNEADFFLGTTTEWEALTSQEKAKYDEKLVFITDDSSGSESLANRFTTNFIDISGYDSQSDLYTFPSDGYVSVIVYNEDTAGLTIYGADGYIDASKMVQLIVWAPSNSFNSDVIFVRKGMKCYFHDPISVSGSAARFQPLS